METTEEIMTLEAVREIFRKDRFATENGCEIDEIGENYAKCSLKLTDRHKNAMGGVMGGVPYLLADFAFAVAVNREKMRTVSLNAQVAFLAAAKGERLIAEARCIKNGRSTCYYNIGISDELGTRVAEVNITGFCKS